MISYIFPFVKQNSKNFLFELFSIFDYSKKTGKIALNSFSVLHRLSRGYAAVRVRLRPHQYENGTHNCSKFIYPYYQTGGGRGFAVSRGRESYGKNLSFGQIDERRHLKIFGKSVSGLCRVTIPFTPHQYENGTHNCSKFIYPYHQNRGGR